MQILGIILVVSKYWYAHAVNVITAAMGFYGALKVKSEFLFVVRPSVWMKKR